MMKNIALALAAILSSAPLSADENTKLPVPIEQSMMEQKGGKEALAQIRGDYEAGRFADFLKEVDASYETAMEENQLLGLAEMRGEKMVDPKTWADAANLLQKEKNLQLTQIVKGEKTPFAEKVRSATADLVTSEQDMAISNLSKFRHMTPGTGANKDENALIDLDMEYEYKSIHLDLPSIDGKSLPDRREKHYALKMEQVDKMLSAAQSFEDLSLKRDVELFAQNLDERMAQNWDQYDLMTLVRGKVKPADAIQEKIVAALEIHQEKLVDLTRQYLEALDGADVVQK